MVEIRRGSESGLGGERLPWLEPVEDEDDDTYDLHDEPGGGYGGVILAGLGVLIAIALVTTAVVWFRHHRAATADIGEVIHAEPGPYKVKPANPGGLDTDETGTVSAGTSAGEDIDSVLDLNKVPEQPMVARQAAAPPPAQAQLQPQAPAPAKPQQAVTAQPIVPPPPKAVAPKRVVVAPAVEAAPITSAGAVGGTVQLGAFSSEAKAKAAWKALSGRFAMLKEMTPVIAAVETGEAKTKLFRLRATGGTLAAGSLCARMRVAGDSCSVIGQ